MLLVSWSLHARETGIKCQPKWLMKAEAGAGQIAARRQNTKIYIDRLA